MDNIKFKVWNNNTQKFVSIHDISDWMEQDTFGLDGYVEPNKNGYAINVNSDQNVEILPYTGLQDKKGSEIYIGDIVEIEVETTEGFYRTDRYEVIINDFMKIPVIDSERGQDKLYECHKFCEVIGNVFEMPDWNF